jgi:hypothetical protein
MNIHLPHVALVLCTTVGRLENATRSLPNPSQCLTISLTVGLPNARFLAKTQSHDGQGFVDGET